MKIKTVIFDLDGTLVNAYKAVSRSLNHAFKETGMDCIDDYTIQRKVGHGETKLIRSLVPEDKVTKVLKLYRDHHKDALKDGVKFLPFAKGVIAKLHKQGHKLAIASNRPMRFTRVILRELDIRKYFHYVICADKAPKPKPHPDMLNMVLEKFSVRPSQAVYVGDMTIDAASARRARMKAVIVTTGSSLKSEIQKERPYKIITKMDQFWPVFEEINS